MCACRSFWGGAENCSLTGKLLWPAHLFRHFLRRVQEVQPGAVELQLEQFEKKLEQLEDQLEEHAQDAAVHGEAEKVKETGGGGQAPAAVHKGQVG